MSFFHSTPVKNKKSFKRYLIENNSQPFFYDFKEWSQDKIQFETTDDERDDESNDWVMIEKSGIPNSNELGAQNDGKITPGQRVLMIVRGLLYVGCITKIIERQRLRRELRAAIVDAPKQPFKKPLASFVNWNDTSSLSPFASLNWSQTL